MGAHRWKTAGEVTAKTARARVHRDEYVLAGCFAKCALADIAKQLGVGAPAGFTPMPPVSTDEVTRLRDEILAAVRRLQESACR